MTHALIIDDDRSNLGVLEQLLTLHGMTFTAVQNPTKVLDIVTELDDLELVLLDLEMPDMNGYQLFEKLRSLPQLQHVPIIACTVHANEVKNVRELGFDGFISKPLDVDQFEVQLNRILSGNPVWYAY